MDVLIGADNNDLMQDLKVIIPQTSKKILGLWKCFRDEPVLDLVNLGSLEMRFMLQCIQWSLMIDNFILWIHFYWWKKLRLQVIFSLEFDDGLGNLVWKSFDLDELGLKDQVRTSGLVFAKNPKQP